MTNEIDLEAFDFVDKLTFHKIPKVKEKKKHPEVELKGLGKIIELGEVSNLGFEEFDEETYITKRKFKDVDGKLVGLETKEYSEFKELISKIFAFPFFSIRSDLKTLLEESFKWLLEIYQSKKANTSLTSFLLSKIDSLTVEYYFYFQVKALAIENPIKIGNTELMFFSEKEITKHYARFKESRPEKTMEQFKEVYKDHFESINVFVKVKGVLNRATEIAYREAEIAVDTLKCFCTYYSTEKPVQIFELDYRFKQNGAANYLYMPNGDIKESTLQISNFGGAVPVQLTAKFMKLAETKSFSKFSEFIKNKKQTELYFLTIDLIKQLSAIISTHNNYEKTVKAISLFESICVPKKSTQAKGENYMKKKVIPKLFSIHDSNTLIKLLRQHYEIRNKYLHNYIHLPLNRKDLSIFLEYQRFFILKLIELNNRFTTLSELLDYFEI